MDWDKASEELRKPLDTAHVKPPPQGKHGQYVEGWHVIDEANRIFGFGGWSYRIIDMPCLWSGLRGTKNGEKPAASYLCRVAVTVDDVHREDVGGGDGFGATEGEAHESAAKEAVTDALKRAMRTFGNPMGLALYDKTKANVEDGAAREKMEKRVASIVAALRGAKTLPELQGVWNYNQNEYKGLLRNGFAELAAEIMAAKDAKKAELEITNEGEDDERVR